MIRTEIQTERLRTLSRELRKVPEKDFDISRYGRHTCGSAGCPLGYCPEIFPDDWKYHGKFPHTNLRGRTPFRDARHFFGIDIDTSYHLFSAEFYLGDPPPSDVADRIDELLAKDTEPAT